MTLDRCVRDMCALRLKVFKQKIKHLLFEHKVAVDELRSENTAALKLAAEQQRVADLQLRRDKASLKEHMHHQQLEHEEMVKTIKKVRKRGRLLTHLLAVGPFVALTYRSKALASLGFRLCLFVKVSHRLCGFRDIYVSFQ